MSTRFTRSRFGACACVLLVIAVLVQGFSCSPDATRPERATVMNAALQAEPVANAGMDVNISVGDTVMFDGSASAPSEGATIVNYTWNFTYLSKMYYMYGVSPNFTFNSTVPGGLFVVVTLNVTDSSGRWDTDTVTVLIHERPQTFVEKYFWDIVLWAIIGALAGYFAYRAGRKLARGDTLITAADREKSRLFMMRTGKVIRQLMKNPMGAIGVVILAFFTFLAIFGPVIAPYDVSIQHPTEQLQLPSKDHWMGTDNFGIDIFSELLYGARTSIIVGMVSAMIASFLGAAVGLYSGYVGGWKDELVMRLNDIVLSIPWLVLMIVVAAFMGTIDLTGIILIIGLTGWSTTARMVRAQVLSVKERQYIERARALGSSDMDILRRHVFPNTFPLVFANTILTVAVSILSEATLSFLGMRPAGTVTWGTMLSFAEEKGAFQYGLHWWILAPGICIVVVVLGFTLLGYALDEILNPKLRHR